MVMEMDPPPPPPNVVVLVRRLHDSCSVAFSGTLLFLDSPAIIGDI